MAGVPFEPTESISYTPSTPLIVDDVVPVLLALADDGRPVDMANPDMSPEVVVAHVTLEDGPGGVMVSMMRVLGVVEPMRVAEISDGMMAEGNEVMDSPLSVVVVVSIADMESIWATAAEVASARRNHREAITAERLITV